MFPAFSEADTLYKRNKFWSITQKHWNSRLWRGADKIYHLYSLLYARNCTFHVSPVMVAIIIPTLQMRKLRFKIFFPDVTSFIKMSDQDLNLTPNSCSALDRLLLTRPELAIFFGNGEHMGGGAMVSMVCIRQGADLWKVQHESV